MANKNLLKILFVEDLQSDVELAVLELQKEKLKFEHTTVCSRVDLIKALNEFKPDLIISDYMMPAFNGLQALKEVKEFNPEIPFILCTGSINEETAVECIKAGATDYVIKEHLTRLPFAVKEALEQHRIQIEKRTVELLLKESEERFRALYNDAVVGLYRTNLQGEILLANNALVKMLGFSSFEELAAINLNRTGVGTTYQRQIFIDQIERDGEVKDLEAIWICRDGTEIFVRENAKAICDSEGKIIYYDGTVEDITDRKRAQEALIESEMKYRQLVTQSPDGIFIIDLSGKFISGNKAICDNLKYSEEELLTLNMWDIVPEQYHSLHKQRLMTLMAGKSTNTNAEYVVKGKDGILHSIEVMSVPYYKGKEIIGFQGIARDISERKKAEDKLRSSEERLKILFDYAPDAYYLSDLKGIFIDGNIAAEKLMGYSKNELIGKNFLKLKLLSLKQLPRAAKLLVKNSLGQTTGPDEFELSRKDKSKVTVEIITHPIEIQGKTLVLGIARDITERRRTEDALQKSQQLFQTLALVSPVGIFRIDIDGNTTYVNPKYSELTGLSFDEAMGSGWLNAVYPDDKEKLKESWLTDFKSRKISSSEYRFLRPDGSIVWVMGNAVPELIGNKLTGYIGTITDITERMQAEEVLRESESSLRNAQEIGKMGSWEWDMKTQKTNWSDNYFVIHGINPAEIEPSFELFRNRIHPDDVHLLDETHANTMKDKIPSAFELRLIQPDGTVKWIQNNISPVIEDDKLVKLKGVIIDITERKQAEEELRKSEEKFRSIMEDSVDTIFLVDQQGFFVYANKAVTNMLGYTQEEVMGKPISFVSPADKIDEYLDLFGQCLKEGKLHIELDLLKKDGDIISTDLIAALLPGGLVSGSFRDITERKLVEKALKHAKEKAEASDKLKTTFLNNISHEVRTPLNGILGFAEIMSQPDLSEDEKKESISMLSDSSDRLLNTITNYMDISLLTSGNMSVRNKDFIPEEVLKRIFDNYKTACSRKNLELSLIIPEQTENLSVNSDPELFSKTISHLLNNAVKFTEKGSIEYGYAVHEQELEFYVKDTGIGIGKESLEIVFDSFAKEDRGPLKITEGSGLGLAISKGFVGLLGGKIRVDSEIGKGSSFFFTIPLSKKNKSDGTIKQAVKSKTGRKKNAILVAEDDEANFFYLQALLRQNTSSDIIRASNGKEAVDKFRQNSNIGLILMDIKMPVMDGLEATRKIKAINRNVPVIAVTAYAMAGDEARILDAGCDHYLTKPVNKKLLLEKIGEYNVM